MTSNAAAAHGNVRPQTIPWFVVAVAFAAVLIDGFDTAAMSAVVPTLSEQWGIPAAEFTFPLVLTNIGVVVGYLSCGSIGAWMGRRLLLILSVAACGVFTLLTAVILPLESVSVLAAVRLVTGFAIGVVLPVAVSVATDLSPERHRQLVSVTVTLGLASGLTLGGVFGGWLIENIGSAGMFWAGGLAPIPLVVLLALIVSEPQPFDARADAKQEAKVARLFDPGLRGSTVLLWSFSFLVFIAAYTLTSWVPTLLTGYGFSAAEAPIGLAYVSFGGVLGGLILIPVTARIGIARALIVMPLIAIVCMAIVSRTELGNTAVLFLLLGAGVGVTAGQIGQLTMAVSVYPGGARTTGVGWAAALGRIGSIVGPGVAGLLIALAVSAQDIILIAAAPVLAAAGCAALLARRQSAQRAGAVADPGASGSTAAAEDDGSGDVRAAG